jgi:hypothetical protein
MTHKTMSILLAASACVASTVAGASDKAACTDAYGKAQTLRDSHQLVSAREQLRICARSSCTAFIAKDCTTWLVETEARIPSVVLAAREAGGLDLANVAVSMDGKSIAQKLDGRSIEIDPGQHAFLFVLADGRKVEQSVLVLEGQKAQRVSVTIPAPAAAPTLAVTTRAAPAPSTISSETAPRSLDTGGSSWSTQKTLGLVMGGVGVAGLAVGTVFGAMAMSKASSSKDLCSAGNCPAGNRQEAIKDHDDAAKAANAATVGFIAGGALAAAGAVLFFTAPSATERAGTLGALRIAPIVGPDGNGVWMRGSF